MLQYPLLRPRLNGSQPTLDDGQLGSGKHTVGIHQQYMKSSERFQSKDGRAVNFENNLARMNKGIEKGKIKNAATPSGGNILTESTKAFGNDMSPWETNMNPSTLSQAPQIRNSDLSVPENNEEKPQSRSKHVIFSSYEGR